MDRIGSWVALQPASALLVDARLQAHHAAQIIVSAAISLLPAQPDDSHTSLGWDDTARALATYPLGVSGHRAALRIEQMQLLLLDSASHTLTSFALRGSTIADAVAWLRDALERARLDTRAFTTHKHYEIPDHPVVQGTPFDATADAFTMLARQYSNAHGELTRVAARQAVPPPVRCWPHHFDIATLLTLPRRSGVEPTRTIVAGLAPGDESYAEPYYYVTPYPYPDAEPDGPFPSGGHWHTQGWVGAVLPSEEITRGATAAEQQSAVQAFLDAAIQTCTRMLDASP
jgi:hypothetical protein